MARRVHHHGDSLNTKARIIKWDERNFVVQTWNEVTNPKTKEKRWEWMDQGFFATIETAAYFATRKGYDTDTVITPDIIREVTRTIIKETIQVMQEQNEKVKK